MPKNEYDDLLLEIQVLKQESAAKEEALGKAWNNFASSINPVAMVKDTLHSLTHDSKIQADITSVAMHAGSSLLIGKILGRNRSIQGYFTSVIVEKLYFSMMNSELIKSVFKMSSNSKDPNPKE